MAHPSLHRWLGPTAWMTAARLVRMASGIALFAALARALSPEALGTWMLALGTWGLLETVREGASSSAYLRFVGVAEPGEGARITGALLILGAGGAGLAVVLGGLVVVALPVGPVRDLVLGFTLLGPVATASGLAHVVLQARRSFGTLFAQQLVQGVVQGLSALAIHQGLGDGVVLALAGMASGHAASILVSAPALRGVPVCLWNTRSMVARLFQHGRHAAASRAGSSLHRSLDLWLVAALAGPGTLAAYAVAWKLADYAEILLQPFVKVLVPEISARGRHPEVAARLAARSTALLTLVIGAASLPLALAPAACIELLAGVGYEAAAPALRALVVFNLLRPADRCAGVYLDAIGLPAANARKVFLALAVNAAATVMALQLGGARALELAAAASVVASVVGVAGAERSMHRQGVPGLLGALRRVLPVGAPKESPHGP